MLIVLLISAIIAALGFMTLRIVNLQFNRINEARNNKNQIILLKRELALAMQSSDSLIWDVETRELSAYNKDQETNHWEFTEANIIKDEDTINLKTKEVKVFSEGKEAKDSNIDALWLEIGVKDNTIPIFISKRRPVATRSDFTWD